MSDQFFTNPQDDPAAEEPFTGPIDDSSDEVIGAPGPSPVNRPKSRRLAAIIAVVSVVALLLFLTIFTRGGGAGAKGQSQSNPHGSMDTTVAAQIPPGEEASLQDLLDSGSGVADAPTVSMPGQSQTGLDERALEQLAVQGEQAALVPPEVNPFEVAPGAPDASQASAGLAATGLTDPMTGLPLSMESPSAPMPTMTAEGEASPFPETNAATHADLARQEALDRKREEAELRKQRAQELAEARKAEEERLRRGTKIAEGQVASAQAGAPGGDEGGFADDARPSSANAARPQGGSRELAQAILPGTRVPAVLESRFSSDVEGGQVVVRLAAALRGKNGVILPAGTKGFGVATATGGTAGQPARVAIAISTWLTPPPEERTIRDEIPARSQDPNTQEMAIPAKVDRHYGERVLRGALNTTIGLAIASQGEQRRSIYDQPSIKEEVLQDTRKTVGAILGADVGNADTVKPTIHLEQGAQFFLLFGMP
jgi:type IV secretory pathway VirB10-like protein